MVEQSRRGFSKSVRDRISSLAIELAGQDEEAFVDLFIARGELAITSAQIALFAPKTDEIIIGKKTWGRCRNYGRDFKSGSSNKTTNGLRSFLQSFGGLSGKGQNRLFLVYK